MEEEIWLPVKGYEGAYEVSSHGRVRSLDREARNKVRFKRKLKGRYFNPDLSCWGYYRVLLHNTDCIRKKHSVHRLVASAFLENPFNKPEVNHINGIKTDNRPENLEWVTKSENISHAIDTGLIRKTIGESHHRSVLTKELVLEIRRLASGPNGIGSRKIHKILNVSRSAIEGVIKGITWRQVK